MKTFDPSKYETAQKAADRADVSQTYLYRLANAGQINFACRPGQREWFFESAGLTKWINAGRPVSRGTGSESDTEDGNKPSGSALVDEINARLKP